MPITFEQAKALTGTASRYGCGASACSSCYPVQFACDCCGADFALPYANGELYECDSCGYESGVSY